MKFNTPSLHVLGRNDVIVSTTRSKTLIDVFESPRIEWHDGGKSDENGDHMKMWKCQFTNSFRLLPSIFPSIGHFVPSKATWRQFFKNYFASYDDESSIQPADVRSPAPEVGDPSAEAPGASRNL
jgi:Serine hydrolase (FSH1)